VYAQAPVGWVIGESRPTRSLVIFDRDFVSSSGPPPAGAYVISSSPGGPVLGIIESVYAGHSMLDEDLTDPASARRLSQWSGDEDLYLRGVVRWLTLLDPMMRHGRQAPPKEPVLPGTPVELAPKAILNAIFSGQDRRWVRLGSIPGANVAFNINVNALTRHLAILAVTGGGKSNTVSVLADRIVGGLNGTMVIFDMHGEYPGVLGPDREVVHSPARINPAALTFHELARIMRVPENAHNQLRFLRWAWKVVRHLYAANRITAGEMIDWLHKVLLMLQNSPEKLTTVRSTLGGSASLEDDLARILRDKGLEPPRVTREDSLAGILNRVEDFIDMYSEVLSDAVPLSLEQLIPPGKLTIFDLSPLDEGSADAVASHYLRRLLAARKQAIRGRRGALAAGEAGESYPKPVIAVVEEAHILIPREGGGLTKYWASRVAREGRKFGLGLVIVSQRPKKLDDDVLSQTNNKIILRMVEPEDIRYVQRASEELSDDIASLLPTLSPGEAIVIGSMAKLPALVKIDYYGRKRVGSDIDLAAEWAEAGEDDVDAYF